MSSIPLRKTIAKLHGIRRPRNPRNINLLKYSTVDVDEEVFESKPRFAMAGAALREVLAQTNINLEAKKTTTVAHNIPSVVTTENADSSSNMIIMNNTMLHFIVDEEMIENVTNTCKQVWRDFFEW